MRQIELSTTDTNLLAGIWCTTGIDPIDGDTKFIAFEATDPAGLDYHIVFNGSRGGIAQIGSGSDGSAHWTDAATAAEVLDLYLADDMRP